MSDSSIASKVQRNADSLIVASGGEIDVEAGGALKLAGTAIAATAAEINRAADVSARIVNVTAATLAVTELAHDGKVVTLNRAGGIAVTLPAATGSGMRLRLIVGTTFTTAGTIKVTGDDVMAGLALLAQDGGDTVVAFAAAADSDTITLDGSTTGGIKGADVELIDIAADLWFVNYRSDASGTEASPFSATV
jgi:hypothetical protein